MKASTLVVRWDERATATPVRFGQVKLEIGEQPTREDPIPAPVPVALLSEPETKPSSAKGDTGTELPAVEASPAPGEEKTETVPAAEAAEASSPEAAALEAAAAKLEQAADAASTEPSKGKGKRKKKAKDDDTTDAGTDDPEGDDGE